MANTHHKVYLQLVFAVKYRKAVLDTAWRKELFAVMGNLVNETGCTNIIVNGVEDYVHLLVSLKPSVSISELMKTVKAKSSKYVNNHQLTTDRFEWQRGYGVFSYSQSHVDNVFKYILNQEAHHRNRSLREEYVAFLEKFEIEYDEEYLFEDLI